MTRQITVEERRARLATRHRLLPDCRGDDVPAIADALVALHSSDPATVHLSAMARMAHPAVGAVEDALYEQRSLVRHHAMRRTLWVGTPDVVRSMHAAATRRLAGPEHRRTAKLLEAGGVTDPDRWLADARGHVATALHEHGPMTARRLGELVPELRQPLQLAPGKKYAATVSAHTRVLLLLGFEGVVVRTRPSGSWINSQYTWAAMDQWLPGGLDGPTERDAARDLADRWLRSFGPGTAGDLRWWAGWTVGTTRRALADCGAVPVDLDGTEGWVASGDEEPTAPVGPWVALLPGLDPTTMGWKERAWYLEPSAEAAFDRNGNAGPTIWADGRVVGAWAQLPDGEIRTHLFEDVGGDRRKAIAARADELRAMIGDVRFTVRFPGRIHETLVG
jgi:hypothetical protein